MKGSRRIPFPSSELRKWSVSLLYVGRQRAAQNHNTSVWYVQKHRKGTGGWTTQVLCLDLALCLLTHFTKWLCVCTITQHSTALNSRQVKPELGCGTTSSHLHSQKVFMPMVGELWVCISSFSVQMKATITAYDSPSVHAYEDLNICTTCVYWAALFDQEQRKSSKNKLEKQGVKSAENCLKAATLFF